MKSLNIKKINKKLVLIITPCVAIILIALVFYVYAYNGSFWGWTPYPINSNSTTDEQNKNGQQIKDNSAQNSQKNKGSSGSDQPPIPSEQTGKKSLVDLIITAANQNDGVLQIRSLISSLDASGTCTLQLQKSGSLLITKNAEAQASSNTSTCKGFDVPVSELTPGEWLATITYETSTIAGYATENITIE